jgi:hypothetical protein
MQFDQLKRREFITLLGGGIGTSRRSLGGLLLAAMTAW